MVSGEEDRAHPSFPSTQSTLERSGHGSLDYLWHCMTVLASCSHKAQLLSSFLSLFPVSHSCHILAKHFSPSSLRLLRDATKLLFQEQEG